MTTHLHGLGLSKEFEGVTHILRTGDSGPHFHSWMNIAYESQIEDKYGIAFETHLFCKRHAYNLCDAHGGVIKRLARRIAISGEHILSAVHFARAYNKVGLLGNSKAYAITNINRAGSEEAKKNLHACVGIKRACVFQYSVINPITQAIQYEPGAVRMYAVSQDEGKRPLPGNEPVTCQIIRYPKDSHGHYCAKCTNTKQYPTYHTGTWHAARTPMHMRIRTRAIAL
jgi:hypothetical protein